jgi:hypothetical protein
MRTERILLHVGTTKTGTSALQKWCNDNRALLLEQGIDYPETSAGSPHKHQELVADLMSGGVDTLMRHVSRDRAPCLFLSTEGLSNHLYDYRPMALQRFREALAGRRVEVFLVHRETSSWLQSLYRQVLVNSTNPAFVYGTALSLEEFSRLPRIRRQMNIPDLIEDLSSAYGAEQVTTCRYEEDWFGTLCDRLGLAGQGLALPRLEGVNLSITADMAELMRQLNALSLPEPERRAMQVLFQNSWKTGHALLAALAAANPPDTLPAEKVGRHLAALVPATKGQRALLEQVTVGTKVKRFKFW